jgi:hypothetical protein
LLGILVAGEDRPGPAPRQGTLRYFRKASIAGKPQVRRALPGQGARSRVSVMPSRWHGGPALTSSWAATGLTSSSSRRDTSAPPRTMVTFGARRRAAAGCGALGDGMSAELAGLRRRRRARSTALGRSAIRRLLRCASRPAAAAECPGADIRPRGLTAIRNDPTRRARKHATEAWQQAYPGSAMQ